MLTSRESSYQGGGSFRSFNAQEFKDCIDPIDFYQGELTREFSPQQRRTNVLNRYLNV